MDTNMVLTLQHHYRRLEAARTDLQAVADTLRQQLTMRELEDVAKAADVSPMTVRRQLAGESPLKDDVVGGLVACCLFDT